MSLSDHTFFCTPFSVINFAKNDPCFLHRAELTTGAPNIRLQLGMFTVYPAVGSVQAGGSVQVTVDMIAENPGFSEEVSLEIESADEKSTIFQISTTRAFSKSIVKSYIC